VFRRAFIILNGIPVAITTAGIGQGAGLHHAALFLIPTLCVGMRLGTLCVPAWGAAVAVWGGFWR